MTYTCDVSASSAGTYVPVFTYSGDANYLATAPTSGSTTSVAKSTPTVGVVANAQTALLGSNITFTATVTGPASANSPTALGTWSITGVSGVTSCATTTGPVAAANISTYTCTVVASLAGTYGATFTFAGDSSYNVVTAVASTNTTSVTSATPAVVLTASGAPTLGGSVTFTATVAGVTNGAAPTGVMNWSISGSAGANSCTSTSGPLSVGVVSTYTCTVLTPRAGTYIVQANLATDANYLGASSSALTETLAQQTPIISLAASANPTLNGITTLTTTITGISGALQSTGAVTVAITDPNNGAVNCINPIGPTNISSNVLTYTCTFTTSLPGSYHATSTIAADTNYLRATSAGVTLTVGAATPSIVFNASPATPLLGQALTFSATVVGTTAGAPTGTVTFNVSGVTTSCTTTTGPVSTLNNSVYTCVIATPITGTYTVSATYNGDSNYSSLAATSPISLVVAKATPTIAVTTAPASPVFGGTITYTATVTGVVGATAPAGTITWAVTGATTSCLSNTGPLAGTSANQTIFTCTVAASPAGSYSATATYSGDTNYISLTTTTPSTVVIAQVTPTVVMTGSGGGSLNSTLTFTTTVTGTSGATAPSGTVSWTISGSAGITSCSTTPAATTSGAATTYICTVTASSYGTYIASAHYNGDINYAAATSNSITLGISTLVPTISLTASSSPTLGGTTTLTALVAGTTVANPLPAGSMSWNVTTPTGGNLTCLTTTPTVNTSGFVLPTTAYSCTFPTATAGTYIAVANFPGDSNYNSITSTSVTIVVAPQTPTLSVSGVQSSTSGGQIITYTATITGTTGSLAPTGAPTWTLTGPSTTCSSTTGPVTSGVSSIYTCVVPAGTAGTYSASVSVAADSNYIVAGPSSVFSLAITKLTPIVTVTTSTPTTSLGSTFTFTATVAGQSGGATPTGVGSWSITGVTGINCVSTTGPTGSSTTVTYTCVVSASSSGTYVPVFTYNGDSNYLATAPTSGSTTSVAKATPTVSLIANASSATIGSTITFTATVTGPAAAVAPSATGSWAITGVSGISSCVTTTGPTPSANVSTYTCSVVASLTGTYGATFTFPGDSAYNAVAAVNSSNSTVVATATPTDAIAASGAPTLGGSVTFTGTVTGLSNAAAPSGVMSWSISGSAGSNSCSATTGPISVGVVSTYTCTVLTPSAGTYIVQANLAADANYQAASSNTLTSTLAKQTPIITLAASANPTLNGVTTLTTTITGVSGAVQSTGAVTWSISDPHSGAVVCANQTGPVAISSNVLSYTCTFTTSLTGTYNITSTIATDTNYLTATSSSVSVSVGSATPTIIFTATPTNPSLGQTLTFSATIVGTTAGAPTGTVTFDVTGTTTSCTATTGPVSVTNSSLYTCTIATPNTGTYTATATYSGDSNYSSLAATAPISLVVAKATPTIAVTTAPASPVFGGTITYTATVTGVVGATAPAGSITWAVTGATTSCLSNTGPLAGTSANQTLFTCTVDAAPAGSYSATATYSGDTNYTALAATVPTTVVIAKVVPVIALTGTGGGSLNSTLTFTTTVTGTSGAAAPTGSMSWTISGSAGITSCTTTPAATTSGAVATYTCTITASSYGTYIASAHYNGDANYVAGPSNSVTLGISTLVPTISLSASTSPTLGGTSTLTALVAGTTVANPLPAGSMAWTITGPSGVSVVCTTTVPSVNTSGFALPTTAYSCTFPTATAGTYSAIANFPGDSNYNSINSTAVTIVIAKGAPTLSVTGIQSSSSNGQVITYTATITGTTGSLAPTGAPTWTLTGPSTSCTTNTGPVTSGVSSIYTCAVPATTAGTYTASISVASDSNYTSAGPSTVYSLAITKATPTVTVTTSVSTALLGSTFTFTASVAGTTGGATPSGTGSWSITGVSGAACSSTTGPNRFINGSDIYLRCYSNFFWHLCPCLYL